MAKKKPGKKPLEKEIMMSVETAYVIFKTCLIKAHIPDERLWPESLANWLAKEYKNNTPTPDAGFLRDKFREITEKKDGDMPYPTVVFRTHFFNQLLDFSKANFFELEERFAKPEPPSTYKLLAFKNNIPPLFNEYQPLENMLWRLQMSLCNELYPVTGIHGMPGIGKSFLAFSYASTRYLRYPGGCWYIQAAGQFNFTESLRQLAATEWKLVFDDEEKKDEALTWRKIKKYLEEPYTYNEKHLTLLIFDNVDDPSESFADLIVDANRINHVHILLTTRSPDREIKNIDWLAAEGLSQAESRELLGRFRPIAPAEQAAVDNIITRIGGFALALALIGALLDKNPETQYSDILADLETGQIQFLDYSGGRMKDIPGHYEQKVLTLLLAPLLAGLDEESRCVLDCMTLLPPDQVPLPWVEHFMKMEFPDRFPTPLYRTERSQWQELVDRLKKLSLINATASNRIVRMHRLLQDIIVSDTTRTPSLARAGKTLQSYIFEVTGSLIGNSHLKDRIWQLPVLSALAEKYNYPGTGTSRFFNDLGIIEKNLGDYKAAEAYFLRAIELMEQTDFDPEKLCRYYADLSGAKREMGKYADAKEWTEKAIGFAKEQLRSKHPLFSLLYKDMGLIEKLQGNYGAAKDWLEPALNIQQYTNQIPDRELADLYASMGLVERGLENYQIAKTWIELATEIAVKTYRPGAPSLSSYFANMALIEQNLFHYPEARRWMSAALDIYKETLEPDHPNLAGAYAGMAMIDLETGNLASAKTLMTQTMEIEAKHYDAGHPIRANSYFQMGMIEQELRNFDEAKEWMLKSLAIDTENYEPGHHRLLRDYSSLGVVEMHRKNLVDAKVWLNKTLLLVYKAPIQPLANLALCYSNIGMIELEGGNLKDAKKWLDKAVKANEEKYQPGHPAHALTYCNMAIVCYREAEYDEARQWMTEAVSIGENFPEKERLKLGNYYFTLGLIEIASGHPDDAKRWFLKAIVRCNDNQEHDTMKNAYTMTQLSMIERQLGNYVAAREWMLRSIQLEEKLKAPHQDEELAISYTNLGLIELDDRKYLQAKRWFRRAIEINEKFLDPFHYRLGLNYYYLGLTEFDTDDVKEGCRLLEKAYPIFVNTLGKENPTSLQCLLALQKNCRKK